MNKFVSVFLIISALSLSFFSTVNAAKPITGTLGAVVLITDINGDFLPNYGDTITYQSFSTDDLTNVFVETQCLKEDGNIVLENTIGLSPTYPFSRNINLISSVWTGGGADCTATPYELTDNGKQRKTKINELKFHVYD